MKYVLPRVFSPDIYINNFVHWSCKHSNQCVFPVWWVQFWITFPHEVIAHLISFFWQNDKGQSPADVVPDPLDMPLEMADAAAVAKELLTLLRQALPGPISPLPLALQGQSLPALSDRARIQLASMGIQLGDRVVIARQKVSVMLL